MRIQDKTTENEPLNPIALTLAIWLGLVVCVTGLTRLSDDAANQAALTQSSTGASAVTSTDDFQLFNPRLMAFGG